MITNKQSIVTMTGQDGRTGPTRRRGKEFIGRCDRSMFVGPVPFFRVTVSRQDLVTLRFPLDAQEMIDSIAVCNEFRLLIQLVEGKDFNAV